MTTPGAEIELQEFLRSTAPTELADVLAAVAATSRSVAAYIRRGAISGSLGAAVGVNSDGDTQKALDIFADDAFEKGLKDCSVRALASEERDDVTQMVADGKYIVAVDPLDGSSNIDINMTIGTIVSVLDAPAKDKIEAADFTRQGHTQRAAVVVLYGPHTSFVFTTGAGTHVATLEPTSGLYYVTHQHVTVPEGKNEFAINMSNSRHWPEQIKAYVDDLVMGAEGPRNKDFNMRWIASMAADVYRVLIRGGVFLYPDDARPGYGRGRLHLLYEANPVAFIIEQAGGLAIDGVNRILDIEYDDVHARTPLIFGSTDKVEIVRSYYLEGHRSAARAPLFGRRGLWRAS